MQELSVALDRVLVLFCWARRCSWHARWSWQLLDHGFLAKQGDDRSCGWSDRRARAARSRSHASARGLDAVDSVWGQSAGRSITHRSTAGSWKALKEDQQWLARGHINSGCDFLLLVSNNMPPTMPRTQGAGDPPGVYCSRVSALLPRGRIVRATSVGLHHHRRQGQEGLEWFRSLLTARTARSASSPICTSASDDVENVEKHPHAQGRAATLVTTRSSDPVSRVPLTEGGDAGVPAGASHAPSCHRHRYR